LKNPNILGCSERCSAKLKVNKMGRFEVRIGGFGGQGVVTMAVVAGETASLYDKKYVVQTHLYDRFIHGYCM